MIGEGVISKQTSVPGWHSDQESEALIALVKQYVPETGGIIVEVGCEYGKSTSEFAYAVKDKQDTRIVSVDLFPDDHHLAKHHGGLFNVWESNLQESGVINTPNLIVIPMRGISWEIGEKWSYPIDLLFIDAGHHYEEVKKDIAAWADHVKAGGVIIFHDYAKDENAHPLHHEVKQAVDEWFNNRTEKLFPIDAPDSLKVFEKYEPAKKAVKHETSTALEGEPKATQKKTAKAKTAKGATSGKRTGKRPTK